MAKCLELAEKGLRHVAPNPMVGCVIVLDGKIIGKGYHRRFGEEHAEVNAILSVKDKRLLRKSTLYVNLEPCSHFGKTPPCADLIIKHKIPEVVIGNRDPNPKVSGRGIKKLKTSGIKVLTGVLENECATLNHRFFTFHEKKRPYIILKWAQSADGFMAPPGKNKLWLTGPESQKLVHVWRSQEQAIMVGWKTCNIDQPLLTVRLVKGLQPMRMVIDQNLKVKEAALLHMQPEPVWVLNKLLTKKINHVEFVRIDFSKNPMNEIINFLFSKNIQSVIVEGGPQTLRYFINAGLWDEARVFTTKHKLIKGKKSPALRAIRFAETLSGDDRLVYYLPSPSAKLSYTHRS